MTFSKTGLYFQWGGEPQTISYTTQDAVSIELKSVTDGWTCELNKSARQVTITPPQDPVDEDKRDSMRNGEAKFTITSESGLTSTYTVDCYIIGDSMISINGNNNYANSYVLTTPKAAYVFDVSKNGAGQAIAGIDSAVIVWQSRSSQLEHFTYDEKSSTVTFYIDALKDDDDAYVKENGEFVMCNANAVIAVLNSSDEILWSWHLWMCKESNNPLTHYSTYSNGVTFMDYNLGAYTNSNGKSDDTTLILDSYGLYYQWGRKDPFLRPYYHDCSGNEDQYVYSGSGTMVYIDFVEMSAETGTVEYTIANPTTFITNAACVDAEKGDGVGDWLKVSNDNLWNDSSKSLYDPCPYGWRVPASSDFDCLSLSTEEDNTPLDQARKRFGWSLTDGANSYFYLAAGFRSYYDGTIYNMNYKEDVYPSQPEPWEGYYWTSGSMNNNGKAHSTCMYFDLTTTRSINKFNLNYPSKRANAMQIRCVKVK